jgi:hypothetical protein
MGTSQYTRLPRLCDIRAGSRLRRQVHCAHLGRSKGSHARGRAAHRRLRRPRRQDEQWVRASIPECTGCAISEPAADFLGRCTALILAAGKGQTLVVEQLIAAGAGLDAKSNNGYEPIYPAATAVRYPSRQPICGQVHCAHLGHREGSRARGRAAHCRRRRPRSQE